MIYFFGIIDRFKVIKQIYQHTEKQWNNLLLKLPCYVALNNPLI